MLLVKWVRDVTWVGHQVVYVEYGECGRDITGKGYHLVEGHAVSCGMASKSVGT